MIGDLQAHGTRIETLQRRVERDEALIRQIQGLGGVPGPAGPAGPMGPQGNPGPAGAGSTFTHTQTAPAATWPITHSLNRWPSVSVVDSGGSVVIPDVAYVSANQITVIFGSATSGKAYLN